MFQNGPLTIKLTCSASFFVKNESAIRKRHPLKGMDKNLISYTEAGGMHMKKIIKLTGSREAISYGYDTNQGLPCSTGTYSGTIE